MSGIPCVSIGGRGLAHRRGPEDTRALCGAPTVLVDVADADGDELEMEARAAAKLPECAECKGLDAA